MILSLLSAVFVLLIAAFWAFQGLFSSAIMFVETLTAMMVAFGFYEPLHEMWAAQVPGDYGYSGALVLLFLITLAVLRFLTDKFIPGNVHFPLAVDRAGGGLLGLLTGLTIVGTVLVAIQMMPLGTDLLGFTRIAPNDPRQRASIWLNPDGFASGLAVFLSDGRFQGQNRFGESHPDLLTELFAKNCGFQREAKREAPKDAISVLGYWSVASIDEVRQEPASQGWTRNFSPAGPSDPSHQFLVVRLGLSASAAESADGSSNMILFTPAQFRVVGSPAGDSHGAPMLHLAVGMSDLFAEKADFNITAKQASRLVKWPLNMRFGLSDQIAKELKENNRFVVDVVFEVPQGFQPRYIEFKSGAMVELTEKLSRKQPMPRQSVAPPPPPKKPDAAGDVEDEDEEDADETPAAEKPAGGAAGSAAKSPAAASEDEDEDEEDEDEGEGEGEDDESPGQASADASAKKPPAAPKVGSGPKGRLHVASAVEERTGVSPLLPRPLRRSDLKPDVLQGNKFHEGHVVIDNPPDEVLESEAITEFDVPSDRRLVQVGAERVFAGSVLGQVLEFAKRAVSQISVETDEGERHFAVGVYIEATVAGKRVLEIQYYYEPEVPERCLKPPNRLTHNVLRTSKDPKMGFLFAVPPGETIVRLYTSPRSGQDVRIEVPE